MSAKATILAYVRRKPRSPLRFAYGVYRETEAFLQYLARPKPAAAKKFVVYGSGRSGSRLLTELLDSINSIECEEEILHDPKLSALRCVYNHYAVSTADAWGFKLTSWNLRSHGIVDPMDLLGPLIADGYKVIHIRRDNAIRQFVSLSHGQQTRSWHTYKGEASSVPQSVRLDLGRLSEALRKRGKAASLTAGMLSRVPHLSVCYEDDLEPADQHRATVKRVTDFLGVEYSEPVARTKKVLSKPLSEIVENYDELEALVAGTEFERFLTV